MIFNRPGFEWQKVVEEVWLDLLYGSFVLVTTIVYLREFSIFLTEAYADEEAVAIICSEHCACLNLPSSDVHVCLNWHFLKT
ncbi:hypothetical protein P8452_38055 [Trifolium repens]|nr:hypothetical protein P8452_38055 [Trifolium repens]